ncbi:thiol peroxidase [Brevibacterium ravenspurgense]|uniref:Thiol peroxidase n=1 Tax=Brevibacterium ravenspurgense TaxID=479117 RepID=A0A150H8U0_9MICO|nr:MULTISPECIES: thiol peroxidase [Brevibacterium]KXZ58434.1 putative thiol peroxidase [Brevibacterium ravenspurgense]MCG7300091.1 thiol peroxidase [Brevibacterium ravenspurgense]OFT92585.1 lipid hydroperoxide peroxidase [Brevibacterium sp. HMSC24B04]PKY71155.1 thiol peroxidase [Brevibacterium ravenspurgense]
MADITFQGDPITTVGNLPEKGAQAPAFTLVGTDLSDVELKNFAGKQLVINIFPSIDTGVCQASVRAFNEKAGGRDNTVVLNVSKDLPFAQERFCAAEGIDNVVSASAFRSSFGEDYGVTMTAGPLKGLLSRAVVVVDAEGSVVYTEQVPEIGQEPDYEAALGALK